MAVESSKMTRNQVHQKLKENFQALCTRCPQLTDRKDSLDDSLTNLQWLWNLNVNIHNPMADNGAPRSKPTEHYRTGYPGKRQEHRSQHQRGARSRQSKSGHQKANTNFRSSAPVASTTGPSQKYITAVTVDSIGSRGGASVGYRQYRKTVDIVKNSSSPIKDKNDDEKANVFLNKPRTIPVVDEFEFEEKPDVSKYQFDMDSYPLLSDAAFYPAPAQTPTSDHKSRQCSVTVINPGDIELKPLYSLPTLIVMALQSAPNGRMCLSSISQWIRDNCEFYRTSNDQSWQKNVEKTLKQNETFCKVPKKRSHSRKTQWEIAPSSNQAGEDLLGGLPFARIRGLSSLSTIQQSPANRSFNGTSTAAFNLLNRKRKQPMPQKIVRLRAQSKRRRQDSNQDLSSLLEELEDSNPLRDQAPEVGSLKGDFNWNTLLDEFASDNNLLLGETPAVSSTSNRTLQSPMLTSPSPLGESAASSFFSLAFGSLASSRLHSTCMGSESGDNQSNNENMFAGSDFGTASSYGDSSPSNDEMEKLLNGETLFQSLSDDGDVIIDSLDAQDGSISIDDFFQGSTTSSSPDGLDLTVQGHQITAPPHWAPVGTDLESILCESQDSSNLSPSDSSVSSR